MGILTRRIASALVMAPLAAAAAWFGGWWFVLLVSVVGVALAWEWSHLVAGVFGHGGRILALGAGLLPATFWLEPRRGLALAMMTALLACLPPLRNGRTRGWFGLGAVYILLPQLALILIRNHSRGLLLWTLFAVWATDTGAYCAGRTIGGPRLMPGVSPNKTWAGLIGGMLAAALVGWAMRQGQGPGAWLLAAASALLALLAQAGDLAESGLKRYFGVKDSSQLIPGHGGVFDRLDGLLMVAPAVAAASLFWPSGWGEIDGW